MSEAAKRKRVPRQKKATGKKQSHPGKAPRSDSEDIERAVYDGMQDLRAEKPKQR